MSTTAQDLATQYVGRHRNLSPELAADMTTELTEWMAWIGGKAAQAQETPEQSDLQLLTQIFS